MTMKDGKDEREGQSAASGKNPRQDTRQGRLKLALRENLKRRKSQAKGRDAGQGDVAVVPSDNGEALPQGGGEKTSGE
jgi:hypothetical protein